MDDQQAQAANTSFDFTGVEEATGINATLPGTIAMFTITDVSFMKSDEKGTPGLKCTFKEPQGSSFSHTFWLTANALTRVQAFAKYATKQTLNGPMTGSNLEAMFKDKVLPLKVIPQIGNNKRVYADLPFGGFSASDIKDLTFSAKELQDIEKANALSSTTKIDNADTESDGMDTASKGNTPGDQSSAEEF